MIESIEDTPVARKKFKCICDKTGVPFERIKPEGEKLSNTEAAICDEEIPKFQAWLKEKGYAGDCWCRHLGEFINADI